MLPSASPSLWLYSDLQSCLEDGEQNKKMTGALPRGTRYLVYRPYLTCGMGNRMSGFQGTLALAMMTDRALLVDWRGGVKPNPRTKDKYEGASWRRCLTSHADVSGRLDG